MINVMMINIETHLGGKYWYFGFELYSQFCKILNFAVDILIFLWYSLLVAYNLRFEAYNLSFEAYNLSFTTDYLSFEANILSLGDVLS